MYQFYRFYYKQRPYSIKIKAKQQHCEGNSTFRIIAFTEFIELLFKDFATKIVIHTRYDIIYVQD